MDTLHHYHPVSNNQDTAEVAELAAYLAEAKSITFRKRVCANFFTPRRIGDLLDPRNPRTGVYSAVDISA